MPDEKQIERAEPKAEPKVERLPLSEARKPDGSKHARAAHYAAALAGAYGPGVMPEHVAGALHGRVGDAFTRDEVIEALKAHREQEV